MNVLWVEKCVGLPSFKIDRLEFVTKFSISFPLAMLIGDPHSGLYELKSPVNSTGVWNEVAK